MILAVMSIELALQGVIFPFLVILNQFIILQGLFALLSQLINYLAAVPKQGKSFLVGEFLLYTIAY